MSSQGTEFYANGFPKKFKRDPSLVLPEFVETSPDEFDKIYERLSKSFFSGKTKPLDYRKSQLLSLYDGIVKEANLIVEAISRDFKTVQDALVEPQIILQGITEFIENLDNWIAPVEVSKPITLMSDSAKIVREPFGLLLNISPWNFPFMIAFAPLLGAIATGNCCVMKPSELSPNASAIIAYIVEKYLDPDCYAVVNGDKGITTYLLEKKWDFIAYTGNGTVGRIVMAAAAKNLTPTLLELGGKSPAIIDDETCDLRIAARRILWAKCMNAGQICITVDYIICRPQVKNQLIEIMKEELATFFPNGTKNNPDWPCIVNQNHCERIVKLIPTENSKAGHGKVVHGGNYSVKDRFIEPTIITDIDPETSPIMQSEIFGPLIPIIVSENIEKTIHFIKSRDKPLALYIFSDNTKLIDHVLSEISSGGVSINDTLTHVNINTLPFGGVGESGMGSFNGRYGIEQFSHKRSVYTALNYRQSEPMLTVRYPGHDSSELIPLLYQNNLYPLRPSSDFLPKLYNHTVATIRWLCTTISLLTGNGPAKRRHT